MKRKFLSLILCVFSTILGGCSSRSDSQGIKNETAYYTFTSYERKPFEINASSVNYMITSRLSFTLFLYSRDCYLCHQKGKGLVEEYASKNPFQIYQIEMDASAKNYLEKRHDIFEGLSYPTIVCFNNGIATYIIGPKSFDNYTSLEKVLTTQMIKTNVYTLSNKDSLDSFTNDVKDFLVFTYNSNGNYCSSQFNYFYSKAKISEKTTLVLDRSITSGIYLGECSVTIYKNGETRLSAGLYDQLEDVYMYKFLIDLFFDSDTVDSSF